MSITSLSGYNAALKQRVFYSKNATGGSIFAPSVGDFPFWDIGGTPGAGSYASNTTTGVVPTSATTGAMNLSAFSGNAYLSYVEWICDGTGGNLGRLFLYDRLFTCGTFGDNANVTLGSQASYSARVPGGTDFSGLLVCAEYVTVTALTKMGAITVGYTNQSGTAGHSTGAVTFGWNNAGHQRFIIPIQAGDTGVQKIESVVTASNGTTMTIGISVLRPIWSGVIRMANEIREHWLDETGFPEIFANSCLEVGIKSNAPNSTSPGVAMTLEIASA